MEVDWPCVWGREEKLCFKDIEKNLEIENGSWLDAAAQSSTRVMMR